MMHVGHQEPKDHIPLFFVDNAICTCRQSSQCSGLVNIILRSWRHNKLLFCTIKYLVTKKLSRCHQRIRMHRLMLFDLLARYYRQVNKCKKISTMDKAVALSDILWDQIIRHGNRTVLTQKRISQCSIFW